MRRAASYILAFFIMLDTVFLTSSAALMLTLGSESYYHSKFETNEYISACTKSIQQGVNDLSLASGIPESAVKDVVSYNDVRSSLRAKVGSLFEYLSGRTSAFSSAVNTVNFKSALTGKIDNYVKSGSANVSAGESEAIGTYIKKCEAVYNSNMIQIPYFESAAVYLRKLFKLCRVILPVSGALLLVLAVICCLIRRGGLYQRLQYALYGLTASAAITALPCAYLMISRLPYRLNFASADVRLLVGSLISGVFSMLLIISLCIFTCAVILVFIIRKISRQ